MSTTNGKKLRSQEWWGTSHYESFARRAWLRSEGFAAELSKASRSSASAIPGAS